MPQLSMNWKKKPSVSAHSSLCCMPLQKQEHNSFKESSQAFPGFAQGRVIPFRYLRVEWKGSTGLPPGAGAPKAGCFSSETETAGRSTQAISGGALAWPCLGRAEPWGHSTSQGTFWSSLCFFTLASGSSLHLVK